MAACLGFGMLKNFPTGFNDLACGCVRR